MRKIFQIFGIICLILTASVLIIETLHLNEERILDKERIANELRIKQEEMKKAQESASLKQLQEKIEELRNFYTPKIKTAIGARVFYENSKYSFWMTGEVYNIGNITTNVKLKVTLYDSKGVAFTHPQKLFDLTSNPTMISLGSIAPAAFKKVRWLIFSPTEIGKWTIEVLTC